MVIPASSTEYLHIPVTAPAGIDLTGTPVRIAIVAHDDNPADSEWQTATWGDDEANLLVGPDTATLLDPGDYHVWINVDVPGPENIVRRSGALTVT